MKKFLIFIVVLLSNSDEVFSCGYSPYGEDVRYSLFLPHYFDYTDYQSFNYNALSFGFDFEYKNRYESNVYDWYEFTRKKVSIDEISECLNELSLTDIHENSTNQFVQYIYKNKLQNIIKYFKVAKRCEAYNSLENDDHWERNDGRLRDYKNLIKELSKIIEDEKDANLKRKYAFLTIRAAFYCQNFEFIKVLYKKHFETGKKDYLYYWALFFNCFENKNASIDIANVMVNSQEKHYATYYYFHKDFNLREAIKQAKSSSDLANIYAYASVQRLEPNLDYLKKIYENSNKLRILDFLLLREINKIEDWIYTPYYTNYLPSVEDFNYWWSDQNNLIYSANILRTRSEKDRLYAQELLEFINAVDLSKIKDKMLWKASQIQLLFITRNYPVCLKKIDEFQKKYPNERVISQIEKIKVLCLVSNQQDGKAIIPDQAKPLILKNLHDEHFLFSLGRELEFRGNLPDGLALISYANSLSLYEYSEFYNNSVEWQGNRLATSGNLKYFYEYFDYLDFVYNAKDLQNIVDRLNIKIEEDFLKIIYSQLLNDKNYLSDLLGTKYIRENNLSLALKTFESIGDKYWEENYNSWERDRFDDGYVFDQNPFYEIKYTKSFIPQTEKYLVTKLSVIQHLIKYLNLANNPKTDNRDYYYFLIGNCYLSMTQYGHSWMMRRFNSTCDFDVYNNQPHIDEMEYRNGNLAQKYYHLAFQFAKTDKFKALCLRMEDFADINTGKFKKLKKVYPEYYEDLSSCENLSEYFQSRR